MAAQSEAGLLCEAASADTATDNIEQGKKPSVPADSMGQEQHNMAATASITEAAAATASTTSSPGVVGWAGPDDPEHPRNWPDRTRWTCTCAVSLFVFMSPVSSAMIAPALDELAADLGLGSSSHYEAYLCVSVFVLAYAVGPVFFGPASELYGRARLLQLSSLWFAAWNLGCGFARRGSQLLAFRFLAGIGASAPLALGGGAISDMWRPEERGRAMGLYTLGPILGPVVGPIAGGFIAERSTWRWVFWSTTAAAAAVQLVGLAWLKESHPGTLLRRRRRRQRLLAREAGSSSLRGTAEREAAAEAAAEAEAAQVQTLAARLASATLRPVRMLATQPIVACVAVYMAYLFGITYMLVATFPDLWAGGRFYSESEGVGGLNYLSIAAGSVVGLLATVAFSDRTYKALKASNKHGGVGQPEFRVPAMAAGSVAVTVGLFWYGWSVQGRCHWIMPNLGAMVYTAGTLSCLQGMQMYVVDSYQTYAASALAACAVLRSLAGFAFPLFSGYLFQGLGYGWGMSVLAFVSIGFGWVAPAFFWVFGPRLRAVSRFASG